MESMEVISEGEWSSFSGIFTAEEADFMAQLLRNSNIQNEPSGGSGFEVATTSWSSSAVHMDGVETGLLFSSDNNSMYSFSQQGSLSLFSGTLFPNSNHESYYSSDSNHFLGTKNGHMSMDYRMEDDKNTLSHVEPFADSMMELNDCLNWDMSNGSKNLQIKMESEMLAAELSTEDKNNPSESSKRKPRNTGDVSVQKNNRNMKPKKNQKLVAMGNNEEDSSVLHMQSSSGCCMEDDSILNLSPKGSTDLNMNGKTRVSRGSATDPQSIYAKKRREKINERLKILQNLVPNGTKVDISTMLEEAVQYVKFLQLQIKLLSSDDLWMYAPIAYNGMDIGLNLNINNSSH